MSIGENICNSNSNSCYTFKIKIRNLKSNDMLRIRKEKKMLSANWKHLIKKIKTGFTIKIKPQTRT